MIVFDLLDNAGAPRSDYAKAVEFLRELLLTQIESKSNYSIIKVCRRENTLSGEVRLHLESKPNYTAHLKDAKQYEYILSVIVKTAGLFPDRSILNPYVGSYIIPFYVDANDDCYRVIECHIENRRLYDKTHLVFQLGTLDSQLMLG